MPAASSYASAEHKTMTGTSIASLNVSDLTFQELIGLFIRRKWIILICILVFGTLGWLYSSKFSATEFSKEFKVVIAGRTQSSPAVNPGDALESFTVRETQYDVLTQISMIQSGDVQLATLKAIGFSEAEAIKDPDSMPRIKSVTQVGVSNTVAIVVTAATKQGAEDFARELPNVYGSSIKSDQTAMINEIVQELDNDIFNLSKDLSDKQTELVSLLSQNEIIDAATEARSRVGEQHQAENSLAAAQADLAGAEAKLNELIGQTAGIPEYIDEVTSVTNRDELEAAKKALRDLESDRAIAIITYAADHPIVEELDTKIKAQKAVVDATPDTVETTRSVKNAAFAEHQLRLRSAEADRSSADARVISLAVEVQNRQADIDGLEPVRRDSLLLESEIDELKAALTKKRAARDDLAIRSSRVLEPVQNLDAGTEAGQTKPRWLMNLLLSVVFGMTFGALIAITRDLALDHVNHPSEAAAIAGVDILARIPIRASSRQPIISDPETARAFESYRILRAGLLLRLREENESAVIVTGTNSGEGKSVVTGNLAVAMASDGLRTLVVDANMRNSSMPQLFSRAANQGLAEVISGSVSLQAAIQDTEYSGLQILGAGSLEVSPTEALSSPEMMSLVEQMKAGWDIVIFDTAGAGSVADTLELTRIVKNVLFVVQPEKTNKSRMEQTLSFLRRAEGRIIGLVLNKDPGAKDRIS
jgi:capsular exopolysaccharide synthesis family protein